MMIEAMACGTPVIAYDGGAVIEVIEEGRTGFIVTELEDATEAVRRIPDLSRARCREVFEKRFTATRMARDYVKVYMRVIGRRTTRLNDCTESSGAYSHRRGEDRTRRRSGRQKSNAD
jgi:hypothetical protein